jgi:hypothetical protein
MEIPWRLWMRVLFIVLSSALIFFCPIAAQAQAICGVIANYFANPPNGFIANRGVKNSERAWATKETLPDAKCTIRVSESGSRHSMTCIFDSAAPATVMEYMRTADRDISRCISQLPNKDDWEKDTRNSTLEGVASVTLKWSATIDEADYSIRVGNHRDLSDGTAWNSIGFVYSKN